MEQGVMGGEGKRAASRALLLAAMSVAVTTVIEQTNRSGG
jgi:hypothetical protein